MSKLSDLCDRVSSFSHWKKLEIPGVGTDYLTDIQKLAEAAKIMEVALQRCTIAHSNRQAWNISGGAIEEIETILKCENKVENERSS